MHRLPLADQLPYQFFPPRAVPFWLWVGRFYWTNILLKREQNVQEVEFQGLEHLSKCVRQGDGVLITPNHPDHADGAVLFELGHTLRLPFYYMTAYQVLLTNGPLARALLPRIGAFPVDREGSDLRAFKTGVEILSAGKNPLVVFPEGEVYRVCDRLTPIREGAAALAVSSAKRLNETGKTCWIVPTAIKYRFIDGFDPMPALRQSIASLEARFTWWEKTEGSLVERIYLFAEGLLALKELEYFGEAHKGPLKPRIAELRDSILDQMEDRRIGKRRAETVPVRVKELRKACLDRLADPAVSVEDGNLLRRDLHDLFVVIQLFSYPGDYVRERPTVDRVAETLLKFEEDLVGYEAAKPVGPRRVVLRLGEAIDVGKYLATTGKKGASAALTAEMEAKIQGLLDEIGPGRPLEGLSPDPEKMLAPRLALSNGSPGGFGS